MCNLYSLNKKRDMVARFFRVSHNRAAAFKPSGPSSRATSHRVKPATWHWFSVKGTEPRPLFAIPGIWRRYKGPMKTDGPDVEIDTYSFLTTTPNGLVATINHERMPVLLTKEEEFETWLSGSADEAFALAREYPAAQMRIVQEGLKEDLLAA